MNKIIYEQNDFPVFQNRMYETELDAINCVKGNIQLVEDAITGLVYNAAFKPELMIYDRHYQNEQAVSPLFKKHLGSVADIIRCHMGCESLVEVGCGKGAFLELLASQGFNLTGFDPTYEGDNPTIKKQYFSPGVIKSAHGLILRHVLEHIQDPVTFLHQLQVSNEGKGLIYIEVPCFDWICKNAAWFDIFYEHVNYFRLSDFQRMFDRVISSGRLFGGQYLYVVADLATLKIPKIDQSNLVKFPRHFLARLSKFAKTTLAQTAIWGGASKGVIFSLLMARHGVPVSTVIDINPAKQRLFLPATGLQVTAPDEAIKTMPDGSTVYVMNSNYLEEIRQMSGNKFFYIGIDREQF